MRYALFSLALLAFSSITTAADWLTLPSTFSHDCNGARVTQFAPIEAPTAPVAANFRTSGYTHTRSSLNYGASSDNYHRVEKWGDPVRPYGEWRFPYRPYSTPYPNWGAPYAGLNIGTPFFGGGYGGRSGRGGFGDDDRDHEPKEGENPDRDGSKRDRRFFDDGRGFLGGGRWPGDRGRNSQFPVPLDPLNPYTSGAGTPYPVPPYYDGYFPPYRD